jgi:sugar phosphate isomerase/epimerase
MDQPLHNYMRPGIVQRLAFPGSRSDPVAFVRSVETIADDDFFTAIEIGAIPDDGLRRTTVEILRASRLSVVYEAHPTLQEATLDMNSRDPARRARAVEAGKKSIDEALQVGAERLNVASGPDPGAAAREEGSDALFDSLCELAGYAAAPGGPTLSLVPFPRGEGGSLIGPTAEAVGLVRLIREVYPGVGLTLDTSHLILMREDTATALALAAPYLGQIHLANVVPAAGDQAPPFGVVGGSLDVPQLVETLLALFRVGFLGAGRRPLMCFRVAPQAGERPEWVIAGAKRTLIEAWARL